MLQAEIEIVEQYSDPRDSKSKPIVEQPQGSVDAAPAQLPELYSKINRDYCRPYTGKTTHARLISKGLTPTRNPISAEIRISQAKNKDIDSKLGRSIANWYTEDALDPPPSASPRTKKFNKNGTNSIHHRIELTTVGGDGTSDSCV